MTVNKRQPLAQTVHTPSLAFCYSTKLHRKLQQFAFRNTGKALHPQFPYCDLQICVVHDNAVCGTIP